MTTPTDTEKLAQALRWFVDRAFQTLDDDETLAIIRDRVESARAILKAHESRAQQESGSAQMVDDAMVDAAFAAWDNCGPECSPREAIKAGLTAALCESKMRAQPAINHDDVDDVLAQVHGLARKINDDPDEAANASADILTIIEKARSPRRGLLAAQPASVADGWVMVPRELIEHMVKLHDERGCVLTVDMDRLKRQFAAAPQPAKDALDLGNLCGPGCAMIDALYERGWTDRVKERDYDPRGTKEWQAVYDALGGPALKLEPTNDR